MNRKGYPVFIVLGVALLTLALVAGGVNSLARAAGQPDDTAAAVPYRADQAHLRARAQTAGSVPVIVGLKLQGYSAEQMVAGGDGAAALQAAIVGEQQALLQRLSAYAVANVKTYEFIPFMALTVDAAGLDALYADRQITTIEEDRLHAPALAESVPLVRADAVWDLLYYDGSGQTVAILDSGVDKFHDDLAGRVASEACYSTNNSSLLVSSLCPGFATSSIATNSGLDCFSGVKGCDHGTHVAGIAAAVAPDANLIAIQVFSRFDDNAADDLTYCADDGKTSPCVFSYSSDYIAGLNRVYGLRNTFDIASVNMSLGAGEFNSFCDFSEAAAKFSIDLLRGAGIATVISAGNSGFRNAVGSPACISTAITVGATDKDDNVASFSNAAVFMDLWAPGANIIAPVPDNGQAGKSGTSMAAPHVAGAVALLKQADPNATVDEVSSSLGHGVGIVDQRSGGLANKPRLDVYSAMCDLVSFCDSNDLRTLILNGNLSGNISANFLDRDHYYYFGAAGDKVRIDMDRTSGTLDPYLELYDPDGTLVATNNNGGTVNKDALIESYTLQKSGRYQVVARGVVGSGNYSLKVSPPLFSIIVFPYYPAPSISYLSPSFVTGTSSGASFWVRIYGRNFTPGSQAQLNGAYRPTYYTSSSLIWIWIYGSDLRSPWPRTSYVQVRNPDPYPTGRTSTSRPFYISYPRLGESELVAPVTDSNITTGIAATFAISWTHPISSWREMQNMDLVLRDENNQTAAWVRLTEGQPDSIMKLLNPAEGGTPIGEGLPGESLDLVITDTVTLHLDQSSFFGSGRTVIMTPTLTFGPQAVGTYNVAFRVDNAQGEVQADDVLGKLTIAPPACQTPLAALDLDGPATGWVGMNDSYIVTTTPTDASQPISYTWSPEPASGQGTAAASYNWSSAGEKVIMVSAENCGAFAAAVHVTQVATTNAPDLGITKDGPAVALAGQPISYTLTMSNSGVMTATNLTVVDTLPTGATYVGGGSQVGDTVTWNLSQLGGYGMATELSLVVTAEANITNSSYGASASGGYSAEGAESVTTRIVDALVELSATTTDSLSYGSGAAATDVTVPGGAVFTAITLAYEERNSPSRPLAGLFAGRAFLLDAYQQNQRASAFSFGEAVTIQLTYADSDVSGLDETRLTLVYWDGSVWSGSGVNCATEAAANQVTCTLTEAITAEYALTVSQHSLFLPGVMRPGP